MNTLNVWSLLQDELSDVETNVDQLNNNIKLTFNGKEREDEKDQKIKDLEGQLFNLKLDVVEQA